jgi:hypothetical protein
MTLPISPGGCLEGRIGASVGRIQSGQKPIPIPVGKTGDLSFLQDLASFSHDR